MRTIDEVIAELASFPAGERHWRLFHLLDEIEPGAEPPRRPVPAWFPRAVEAAVASGPSKRPASSPCPTTTATCSR